MTINKLKCTDNVPDFIQDIDKQMSVIWITFFDGIRIKVLPETVAARIPKGLPEHLVVDMFNNVLEYLASAEWRERKRQQAYREQVMQ
jgi:hypothetical protein